jgi:excisionase family DNA binding protein
MAKTKDPRASELMGWLTINEAARRLEVTRQAVEGRLERGTIEAIRVPSGWLISPDAIEDETKAALN